MSASLSKRLSRLRSDTERDDHGRIGYVRAMLMMLCGVTFFLFVYPEAGELDQSRSYASSEIGAEVEQKLRQIALNIDSESLNNRVSKELTEDTFVWREQAVRDTVQRVEWLNSSFFGWILSSQYESLAETFFALAVELQGAREEAEEDYLLNVDLRLLDFTESLATASLRLIFMLFAFLPLWLLGVLLGLGASHYLIKPPKNSSILGVLDRGFGPFYSGIFGPLRLNESISGIDTSAPGLACPPMEKRSVAAVHDLAKTLKRYRALNETNMGLVQVILAHKDFPAFVPEERPVHEDASNEQAKESKGYITNVSNAGGNVEQSAIRGLASVLEAHRTLRKYYKGKKKPSLTPDDKVFCSSREDLEKLAAEISPLARLLVLSLTPARARAIGGTPATVVASAYLATEAGKSLTYKRDEGRYTQISRFPNLQARAVIHSLTAYHNEYRGDGRMLIRQALVCSRRHGDFGRSFLPVSMPAPSRALRDWLEIMYSAQEKRQSVAYLCELEAHLEEMKYDFQHTLAQKLKQERDNASEVYPEWKGFVYHSVVLIPLDSLLTIVLSHIGKTRLNRITDLLDLTKKLRSQLSISARLPGFAREAHEADLDSVPDEVLSNFMSLQKDGKSVFEKWTIIRRMLSRYNWLSTRVGDESVPKDGLISGSIRLGEQQKTFPAFAPLRQRRFSEILGEDWERQYYSDAPHPRNIKVVGDDTTSSEAKRHGT